MQDFQDKMKKLCQMLADRCSARVPGTQINLAFQLPSEFGMIASAAVTVIEPTGHQQLLIVNKYNDGLVDWMPVYG